jgi:formylglycine-generating enzyme required for sulfatase activity
MFPPVLSRPGPEGREGLPSVPLQPSQPIPLEQLPPVVTNSVGMKFARIPAGSFLMGNHEPMEDLQLDFDVNAQQLQDEYPQHRVLIPNHFYLGVYEVTRRDYRQIMKEEADVGLSPDLTVGSNPDRLPVSQVSWSGAIEFCSQLSALPEERAAQRLYRLPTEAEWEYACRGGADRPPTRYFFGNSNRDLLDYGWPDGYLHPVGQLAPNPLGLYDLLGNAPEWCQDVYSTTYYQDSPAVDPQGPAEGSGVKTRVCRYGPWSANRGSRELTAGSGFRVAFTALLPKTVSPDRKGARDQSTAPGDHRPTP